MKKNKLLSIILGIIGVSLVTFGGLFIYKKYIAYSEEGVAGDKAAQSLSITKVNSKAKLQIGSGDRETFRLSGHSTSPIKWSTNNNCSIESSSGNAATINCNRIGVCKVTAKVPESEEYLSASITGSITCSCGEWVGPTTACNLTASDINHTKTWADQNNAGYYYGSAVRQEDGSFCAEKYVAGCEGGTPPGGNPSGCYINPQGNFVWGQYSGHDGYTGVASVTSEANCKNPTISFNIKSKDSGEVVAGAVLGVYKSNDDLVQKWTTTTTDKSLQLGVGTYYLKELTPPSGYILNNSRISVTVNNDATATLSRVYIENYTFKPVRFKKISPTNDQIVGARLAILDSNHNTVHQWESDGTVKTFTDLNPGDYYFVETQAAPNYILNTASIKFTIRDDGYPVDETLTRKDEYIMTNIPCPSVTINKRDQKTNNLLDGAKIRLIDSEGRKITEWRGATNRVQLCPDKYYVQEVEAPAYYIADKNKYEIEAKDDGTVTPSVVDVYNIPYPEISIMKKDADTKLPLPGAQLSIYQNNTLLKDYNWTLDGATQTVANYYEPWTTGAYPVSHKFGPGTYVIRETIVPDGYIRSADMVLVIDEYGVPSSTTDIVLFDEPYPEVPIYKVDKITGENIGGAKLTLKDSNGTLLFPTDARMKKDRDGDGNFDYWESSSDTFATFVLSPGTYTLEEIEAPTNYVRYNRPITITVSDDGVVNPSTVKVENIPCPKITISKQNFDGSSELPGATINIHNNTTNDNKVIISGLSPTEVQVCPGSYTISETEAPNGYIVSDRTINFTVDEDGVASKKNFVINNEEYPTVQIYKRDRKTNEIVGGASLKLEDKTGTVIAEWTSRIDVPYEIQLAPGTYKLMETAVPTGYILNTEAVDITVDKYGHVTPNDIAIYNTPYPVVYINKIDSITKEAIDGASIKVTDASGNIVDAWETIPDMHKLVLAPGKYIVTEMSPAPNHVMTHEVINIEVNYLGEVIGDYVTIDNRIIFNYENVPYPTIPILKYNERNAVLAGAKLKLVDAENNLIDEWVTTEDDHNVTLAPGKYYLSEKEAPSGYIKSEELIEINVTQEGEANPSRVVMANRSYPVVEFYKKDATTGDNIVGAELVITSASTHEVIDTFTTINGAYRKALAPGTYELKENVAPDGYERTDETITFVVTDTGCDPVEMTNNQLKQISLAKLDSETRALIPGAVLVITDMDNQEVARVTTDSRRVILPKKLSSGQYKLYEESAPEHYVKNDEVKVFTVTTNEEPVMEIDFTNVKMRTLCMYKTDSETNAKVSGAKFRLTNKQSGQIMLEFMTTNDCYNLEVPYGTYVLSEIEAPNHYQLSNDTVEVTIDQNSPRDGVEMVIADPPYRDLSVAKVDTDTGALVPGAKLELTYPDGTKKEIITKNERVIIDDLYYGNYEIKEIEAPENYKYNGQVYRFTVSSDSADTITYDINDYLLRLVSVSKVDSENGTLIPGVTLVIKNSSGTIIDKVVTEDAPVVVHDRDNRLDYGVYSITEEEAPVGYQVNTSPTPFVINNTTSRNDNNLTVIEVTNVPYRKLTVCQLDSETNEKIAGAKLELTYPDGTKKEFVSTTECELFDDIVYGNYQLKELEPANGYDLNNEVLTMEVDSSSDRELTWNIKDNPLRSIIFSKLDAETNKNVTGAKFTLTYPDGTKKNITSKAEGVKIDGFRYGTYVLAEVEAPNHYQLNTHEVNITVSSSSPKEINASISNLPYRKLTICNVDKETKEKIAGASLVLKYPDGHTTKFNGSVDCTVFEDIVYGEYTLKQEEPPEGYELTNDEVKLTVNANSPRELEMIIENEPLKNLSIAVVDNETKVLVPGAKVVVKNSKQESILDYTSGNERELIKKLPYSEYCVQITSVPENYQDPKENPVCVTINKDSAETTYVDIPLDPYYKIKVNKYGVDMESNLPGAKFELRDSEDNVIHEFVTEENATYINKLTPGVYSLIEIEAPEGYTINEEPIPVEIVTGNEITEVTVIDDIEVPITGKSLPIALVSTVFGALGIGCLSYSKKKKFN